MSKYGVEWTSAPEGDEGERNYRITRPTGKRLVKGVCVSHELIGCYVHWWNGKTTPCSGVDICDACKHAQEKEKKYWFIGADETTLKRFICQITPGAARQMKAAAEHFGRYNGLQFELGRTNGMDNGPMYAHFKKTLSDQHILTDLPDLMPMLYRMWRYDPEVVERARIEREKRECDIRAEAEAMVLQRIADMEVVSKVKPRRRKRS